MSDYDGITEIIYMDEADGGMLYIDFMGKAGIQITTHGTVPLSREQVADLIEKLLSQCRLNTPTKLARYEKALREIADHPMWDYAGRQSVADIRDIAREALGEGE